MLKNKHVPTRFASLWMGKGDKAHQPWPPKAKIVVTGTFHFISSNSSGNSHWPPPVVFLLKASAPCCFHKLSLPSSPSEWRNKGDPGLPAPPIHDSGSVEYRTIHDIRKSAHFRRRCLIFGTEKCFLSILKPRCGSCHPDISVIREGRGRGHVVRGGRRQRRGVRSCCCGL